MPILTFLGEKKRLPLLHMAKRFIWINETKKPINEFVIGYIINPGLNVNKALSEQAERSIYNTFVKITQPFIKATL